MEEQGNKLALWKISGRNLVMPFLLLIIALFFRNQLYGVFGESNYLTIHILIETFIIVTCFTIAIQAWLIFPYILSNQRLYIGALFLATGLLEILHTLSYKGMPYFIMESSAYSATWFYIIGRVMQALGLLLIFTIKRKQVQSRQRWIIYSLGVLFAVVCAVLIYSPIKLLPDLVIDGVGPTDLKKGLQYLAIVLQLLLIFYLWKKFEINRIQNAMIIMASINLILGDSMFTTYQSVYDIKNFLGHLFQLTGFYYMIRALYYSSVEEPFQSLMETQKQLKKSEEALHYLAYHDELTNLPNSRFFTEKLKKELELKGAKKAIIIIEIDRLKSINESLGLSFGDLMLQKVADRLRESLPSDLFISKMRGGEFTLIFLSVEDA